MRTPLPLLALVIASLASCAKARDDAPASPAAAAAPSPAAPAAESDTPAPRRPAPRVATPGTSELLLTSASYKVQGRSFEVDALLNLSSVRRYRFTLSPAVRRAGRDGAWLPAETVPGGRFRVRFLLETSDLQSPTVIDAREVEAECRGGVIVTDVEFRFGNLTQPMGRLRLSLEIQPLDDTDTKKSAPVSDNVTLLRDGTLFLAERAGSLDEALARATRPAAGPASSSNLFAVTFGLEPVKPALAGAATTVASGDDSALAALCDLFYEESWAGPLSYLRRCRSNPAGFLSTARTKHTSVIRNARLVGAPESLSVSMNAGLSISQSDSTSRGTSQSQSVDGHVGVSGELPLLNLVGIHVGAGVSVGTSWSYTVSQSSSTSRGRGAGVQVSRTLNVDHATFTLEGDAASCVTIAAKGVPNGKRYFQCAEAKPVEFQETYYFLFDATNLSSLQDPDAPAGERPFLALIRGSDRFESFVHTLENRNLVLENLGSSVLPPSLRGAVPAGGFDGLFPGLVSP